jgi:hypothetical protein
LLLLLLAGAIINVAVAWGCVVAFPAVFVHPIGFARQSPLSASESEALLIRAFPNAPVNAGGVYGDTYSRHGWVYMGALWSDDDAQNDDRWIFLESDELVAGWPCQSFLGCSKWDGRKGDGTESERFGTLELPQWVRSAGNNSLEFLPFMPIWPGFAINTVFYAAIVWVLFAVPGMIRRRVRRKRGQCAACGYSLRGSVGGKCPECGAPSP